MVPGLKKRLMEGSSEDIIQIAELVRRYLSPLLFKYLKVSM